MEEPKTHNAGSCDLCHNAYSSMAISAWAQPFCLQAMVVSANGNHLCFLIPVA